MPVQLLAFNEAEYYLNCEWLVIQFTGPEVLQELQDNIIRMHQGMSEALCNFYIKICYTMQLAELDEAANQLVLQTIFMNGLYPKVHLYVEQFRVSMLTTKVTCTQGYWSTNYKGQ